MAHAYVSFRAPHRRRGELRSRFWIGAELALFSTSAPTVLINRLLNRRGVRRRVVPSRPPLALARHCAAEYANVASLLPQLYRRYGEEEITSAASSS